MCHQTVSLIARHLEANGIATVVMGCARDIVVAAGAPRFYWSDFPLGHSAGKPHDAQSQRDTLRGALWLFDRAAVAGEVSENPQRWSADNRWQQDYLNVAALSEAELQARRQEFQRQKAVASAKQEPDQKPRREDP